MYVLRSDDLGHHPSYWKRGGACAHVHTANKVLQGSMDTKSLPNLTDCCTDHITSVGSCKVAFQKSNRLSCSVTRFSRGVYNSHHGRTFHSGAFLRQARVPMPVVAVWDQTQAILLMAAELVVVRIAKRPTNLQRRLARPSQGRFRRTQKSHDFFKFILQVRASCATSGLTFLVLANAVRARGVSFEASRKVKDGRTATKEIRTQQEKIKE